MRVLLSFGPIGYSGEVVTLDSPGETFYEDIPFPVHALGPQHTTYGWNRKLYSWLRENRDRFDGIVVNGLWQYCGLAAWLALRGRKPYVVFTHGMLDPYFKHNFPLKHVKKWAYWLFAEYWVLRDAYRVLFTTKEESRLAEQSFWLFQWNGYVVPYGASRPPKEGDVLREAFYALHPEMRGRRFMLFLGRIHRKKGCDMLIRAFVKLAALDPGSASGDGWSGPAELERWTERKGDRGRADGACALARDAEWRCEVGCVLRLRGVCPAFAPGELRDCGGGGAGLQSRGAACRQGKHCVGDRG